MLNLARILMSAMGRKLSRQLWVESCHFGVTDARMSWYRVIAAVALALGATACSDTECKSTANWRLASLLTEPSVPYTPRPVYYAEQQSGERWSERFWREPTSTVSYEQMVRDTAKLARLNPRPSFYFHFVEGQSCGDLREMRERIAKAAACSAKDPCIEGKPK